MAQGDTIWTSSSYGKVLQSSRYVTFLARGVLADDRDCDACTGLRVYRLMLDYCLLLPERTIAWE